MNNKTISLLPKPRRAPKKRRTRLLRNRKPNPKPILKKPNKSPQEKKPKKKIQFNLEEIKVKNISLNKELKRERYEHVKNIFSTKKENRKIAKILYHKIPSYEEYQESKRTMRFIWNPINMAMRKTEKEYYNNGDIVIIYKVRKTCENYTVEVNSYKQKKVRKFIDIKHTKDFPIRHKTDSELEYEMKKYIIQKIKQIFETYKIN
jgi:hypothetical protein